MAATQLRCPACGLTRPQPAFERAGAHDLAAIRLEGLGFGRGFRRTLEALDAESLDLLGQALDRARAQVTRARQALLSPARPAVAASSWCCNAPLVRTGPTMLVCEVCGRSP